MIAGVLLALAFVICFTAAGCKKDDNNGNGSPIISGKGGETSVFSGDGGNPVPVEWNSNDWGDSWEPKG